ncbi:MAG: DUF4962 domain-containing protein [Planctomycetes bacterium]|nr:DUF4962 domain-containing protein [Planctomycetota bacterium]
MKRIAVTVALLPWLIMPGRGLAQPVRIGAEARVPESPRSHYSRYVNWRPADGETVDLNPPRISWPYWPDWPGDVRDALYTFRLQISREADCANPAVNVTCPYNFYNTLPALVGKPEHGSNRWYWRVGYEAGAGRVQWSKIRSFVIAEQAAVWDRSKLASPNLVRRGHPRILFNAENLDHIRRLAQTDPGSNAALRHLRRQADAILQKPWWNRFPATDRAAEPTQEFYTIAQDLATVCFVWRMTGDDRYAGVKSRAVTWASYPPGGRASPEGLGGDGNEDATHGNEFLALLFDWLYPDLTADERQTMIASLEWRIEHIMNNFSWKNRNRKDKETGRPLVRAGGMSGMISSHGYEAAMGTAACGLALYEHSEIGREWFDLILNYMIGITCGHGFDEAWNEGAGYGTSKCKWLMNATMYFDTTLPEAQLGRNPYYRRLGEFFRRVIPVGMPHHAWGNQASASRGNHLAHFRKLAYLTGDGCFLLDWQQYGGTEFSTFRPWIEYVLPAYYAAPQPQAETDTVGLFPIDGWAMAASGPPSLRSTYDQGTGIIFQCRPRGGYGHSFNSDTSFQLHAYGQMLNHGGGSSANGDAFAYHTMSHNTILVDGLGQAQPSSGQLYPTYGRIAAFSRGPDHVYFAGDATRCYPRTPGKYSRWSLPLDKVYETRALPHLERFLRHVLFVRNRYFVIYDDLACSRPAIYTWLYHILPQDPFDLDESAMRVDYAVGDVRVRLQHLAHPDKLTVDDRTKMDAFMNPFTGEDYRKWRVGETLCAHNLWISNTVPAEQWSFLTVVYPSRPGETIPDMERLDDATVRIGGDIITFDPRSRHAQDADFAIDVSALRPQ